MVGGATVDRLYPFNIDFKIILSLVGSFKEKIILAFKEYLPVLIKLPRVNFNKLTKLCVNGISPPIVTIKVGRGYSVHAHVLKKP